MISFTATASAAFKGGKGGLSFAVDFVLAVAPVFVDVEEDADKAEDALDAHQIMSCFARRGSGRSASICL
jgi:hypothetical protein